MSSERATERAGFASVMRHEMTGLGVLMMRRIVEHARRRGTGAPFGDVRKDNATMLTPCDVFGCELIRLQEDSGQVRATLKL